MNSGDPATQVRSDTFKTVLLYDDAVWARTAKAGVEEIATRCGATDPLVVPWRLDLLEQTRFADAALAQSLDADVVLLALAHTWFLPASLSRWLDVWATCRTVPDAALGVMTPPGVSDAEIKKELGPWVHRHKLTWLGDWEPARAEDPELDTASTVADLRQRERSLSPVLREIMAGPAPYRFFGLNE